MLHVGAHEIHEDDARERVHAYLNDEERRYSYPAYDLYRTNDDPDSLCDGDLLAPVLLNVGISIVAFSDLQRYRTELETTLRVLPRDVQLVDATPDHLSAIGACFGLLDSNRRPRGVQGTKLAKLLHRKRPALIPLYDEHIRSVYQDGAKAPVPKVRGRSWQDFMALLSAAIQSDLRRNPDVWSELARLTPAESEPITTVRALDIVAWGLGGR